MSGLSFLALALGREEEVLLVREGGRFADEPLCVVGDDDGASSALHFRKITGRARSVFCLAYLRQVRGFQLSAPAFERAGVSGKGSILPWRERVWEQERNNSLNMMV